MKILNSITLLYIEFLIITLLKMEFKLIKFLIKRLDSKLRV